MTPGGWGLSPRHSRWGDGERSLLLWRGIWDRHGYIRCPGGHRRGSLDLGPTEARPGPAWDLLTGPQRRHMPAEATSLAHFVGGEMEAQSGGAQGQATGVVPSSDPGAMHVVSALEKGSSAPPPGPVSAGGRASDRPVSSRKRPLRVAGARGCCSLCWGTPSPPPLQPGPHFLFLTGSRASQGSAPSCGAGSSGSPAPRPLCPSST